MTFRADGTVVPNADDDGLSLQIERSIETGSNVALLASDAQPLPYLGHAMGKFLINVLLQALWASLAVTSVALIFIGFDNDNNVQIFGGIALIAAALGVRFAARWLRKRDHRTYRKKPTHPGFP